jgi:hypothetical protein
MVAMLQQGAFMRNTVLAAGFSCVLTLAGAEHTHTGPGLQQVDEKLSSH